MAGVAAVGTPAHVTEALEQLEEAGVDQVIMLQQAGGYRHEHICESLELLGREVLPPFIERHEIRERKRQAELAPYIAKAMASIPPIDADPPTVESYPILWGEKGTPSVGTRRSLDAGLLWRMQVGGGLKAGAGK
jgi:hypothetical protein